jgi:hypothetical protein
MIERASGGRRGGGVQTLGGPVEEERSSVSPDRAKGTNATKVIKTTAVCERWIEFLTRFPLEA